MRVAGAKLESLLVAAAIAMASAACVLEPVADTDDDVDTYSGGDFLIIGEDTFLKQSTDSSDSLSWGSEKCRLFAGARINSAITPQVISGHFYIDMTTSIPGCEFAKGYVWKGHVSDATAGPDETTTPPPTSTSCHGDVSVRECALLSTIAYAEGTDNRYNIIFSYGTFSSYADHPRRVLCSGGYCSDAAGRYQFLSTTWDWVSGRLGLGSFAPSNQDVAALLLIEYRGVYNVDGIDTYDEFVDTMYRLNQEWASLPGSPYGQPTHSAWSLWQQYRRFAGL